MLVQTTAKCKVCGKEFNGILQYLKRTCTRCGKVIEPICDECAAKGCSCGGKLLAGQEIDAKNGKRYFF